MTTNPSPPDWRGLCEVLADKLSACWPSTFDPPDCLNRARAALAAEAVAEGPTDEEVEAWADRQGFIRGSGDHPCGFWIDDGDAGAFARAVLARYGHQPAPPAAGEVAELVEWLREKATWHPADEPEAALFDRAADLLEQRHPAPVPLADHPDLPLPQGEVE